MKCFPFTKRAIEGLPAHAADSPSRDVDGRDPNPLGRTILTAELERALFSFEIEWLSEDSD